MPIEKTAIYSILAASLLLSGCARHAVSETPQPLARSDAGTVELSFRDFYKSPVGPLGLEPTGKLLGLAGKRVHIRGYMVQEEEPIAGLFMLASQPVNIPEKEDGPSDDLPGATVFVHMPRADAGKILAYRPGLWDLAGTLQLGAREEANGRVSYVRLLLDEPASQATAESAADPARANFPSAHSLR